jgi:hypothetical protein
MPRVLRADDVRAEAAVPAGLAPTARTPAGGGTRRGDMTAVVSCPGTVS